MYKMVKDWKSENALFEKNLKSLYSAAYELVVWILEKFKKWYSFFPFEKYGK